MHGRLLTNWLWTLISRHVVLVLEIQESTTTTRTRTTTIP